MNPEPPVTKTILLLVEFVISFELYRKGQPKEKQPFCWKVQICFVEKSKRREMSKVLKVAF